MKQVGITGRLVVHETTGEIRDCLDIAWAEYLISLGLNPIHLLYRKMEFDPQIDALILSGGNSLSSVADCELSRMRDEFEIGLLKYCLLMKIPVLGVCRGAQLIWQYFGGGIASCQNHAGQTHLVSVNGVSEPFMVESYHDFALQEAEGFIATEIFARSLPDHLSEGFLLKDHGIMGIMWHPERVLGCSRARDYTNNLIRQLCKSALEG